jgi:bacterioferritin
MNGNEKLIVELNQRLADELTAINHYMVHSEIFKNWGYSKLHVAIRKQALEEMYHAEWLIERIISLDGSPTISKLNSIKMGKTVLEMVSNFQDAEVAGLQAYNNTIEIAHEVSDEDSIELLAKILAMEESHIDWAEIQRSQIEHMGLQNYLANQSEVLAN